MRRVGVTGLGIVACIGNNKKEVVQSLQEGRSGISFVPEMKALGYRCQVAGLVKGLLTPGIDKRSLRTMSPLARFAAVAAQEALTDAQLTAEALRQDRVGVVIGTGAGSATVAARAEHQLLKDKNPARLGATGIVKIMNSTAALNLAAWLGIRGRSYSVSSACATGTDNIGHGYELIRHEVLDLCICGGADEIGIEHLCGFGDALNAMPVDYNDRPTAACRPYDRDRQGMVLSEGAGVVILESLEHAEGRGAPVYAELIGYGSANDGGNMFEPTGVGLEQCFIEALASARDHEPVRIDYINPHGAGTKVGDAVEVEVMRQVFGGMAPLVSSTKALNGHSQSSTGAHEAIFAILMLRHGFVAPTGNLDHVAPECTGVHHVQSLIEFPLRTVLTFNAGLGGTNACLIFRQL
jgi:3-oxoacyl-[acyl-carrier-protein] synthase I